MKVHHGLNVHASDAGPARVTKTQVMSIESIRLDPLPSTTVTNTYVNQIVGEVQVGKKFRTVPSTTGWRMPTPYRRLDLKVVPLPYSYVYELTSSTWRQSGITPVATSVGPGTGLPYYGTAVEGGVRLPNVSQSTINRADTEAIAKLRDSKVSLAESIAEYKLTLGMMTDTALRVATAFRQVKRGQYAAAARTLGKPKHPGRPAKSAAAAWLELQYGWLPLVGDIYGAFEAVQRGIRAADYIAVARRNVEVELDLPPSPAHYNRWETEGWIREGCSTVLWARLSSGILDTLDSVGLLNPASIAWELVPFSFVIDWLFPVGTMLTALTGTVGLDFVSGTRTLRVSGRYRVSGYNLTGYVSGELPGLQVELNCISRSVLNSFPHHSGVYMKDPFSVKHASNLLALLVSLKR